MLYDNSQLARVYLYAWILTSFRSQAVTCNQLFRTRVLGLWRSRRQVNQRFAPPRLESNCQCG